MQATIEMNPALTARLTRLQFARRKTMMRSEKRRATLRPGGGFDYDQPPRERPPRKPRRAGFFYIFITMLLLLLLWPIGLILLWQRRLRWGTLTKLFVSIVTMMACILIIGAALTVEVDDPRVTAIQNEAITYLDAAADVLVDFGSDMSARASQSLTAIQDIRSLYQGTQLTRLADAIDWCVNLTQGAREQISGLFEVADEPEPGATPEPKASPEGSLSPDATAKATPAPTSVPAARITVGEQDEELPVYIPKRTPDPELGTPITEGMILRSGKLELPTPTPTPEPTPEVVECGVKPAGEAIVYFNIGSGEFYHTQRVCGPMKNADEHTFAEVAENIHTPCTRCMPPEKELLEEEYIVWQDEGGLAHTTDECPDFEGKWSIIAAEDAIDGKFEACATCGADRYLEALKDGAEVKLVEPAKFTAAPTDEPTAAPASTTPD